MKKLLFILIAAMSLCACGDDDKTETNDSTVRYRSGNFMSAYFSPQKIDLFYGDSLGFDVYLLDTAIFQTGNDCLDTLSELEFAYTEYKDSPNYDKFVKYTEYYGDTTYYNSDRRCFSCIYPISAINITADKDFDESHPANSSLNDIFYWYGYCGYDFIKNGYKNEDGLHNFTSSEVELSDFRQLGLVDYGFGIFFKQKPSTTGTYTFTVSITFDPDPVTGDTISLEPATTTITFE